VKAVVSVLQSLLRAAGLLLLTTVRMSADLVDESATFAAALKCLDTLTICRRGEQM